MQKRPSHDGSSLVNLVSELERRMIGGSPSPGMADRSAIPDGATLVLVLFDGLGMAQLAHPGAEVFRSSLAAVLNAPFPSTTSVSLSTVATALPPSRHGQVAHLSWYPDLGEVVNTLKWVTVNGNPVSYDYGSLLPRPNLWERLRAAGVEPITVQPADFQTTPLTRVLYRGARFEGAWDTADLVEATVSLAAQPGRLVFTYVPFVDVAGHMFGQGSDEFTEAIKAAAGVWEGIAGRLPPGAALLGTADHGLIEVSEDDKILVRDPRFDSLRFAGDTRGVHLWGDPGLISELAASVEGELVDPALLFGPDPTEETLGHLGQRILLAPPGKAVIPRGFDKRLRCYHGGLMLEELEVPLLVG
ncbi:MAG TPA: alkaline phosphatase family protein [Acidimicrobiia bacterium]|nr:alkaline phosphatase family protein [Acidimicrobiia bacterium]